MFNQMTTSGRNASITSGCETGGNNRRSARFLLAAGLAAVIAAAPQSAPAEDRSTARPVVSAESAPVATASGPVDREQLIFQNVKREVRKASTGVRGVDLKPALDSIDGLRTKLADVSTPPADAAAACEAVVAELEKVEANAAAARETVALARKSCQHGSASYDDAAASNETSWRDAKAARLAQDESRLSFAARKFGEARERGDARAQARYEAEFRQAATMKRLHEGDNAKAPVDAGIKKKVADLLAGLDLKLQSQDGQLEVLQARMEQTRGVYKTLATAFRAGEIGQEVDALIKELTDLEGRTDAPLGDSERQLQTALDQIERELAAKGVTPKSAMTDEEYETLKQKYGVK
jgi:hypothetical protein